MSELDEFADELFAGELEDCENEAELKSVLKNKTSDAFAQALFQLHKRDKARIDFLKKEYPKWKANIVHPYDLDEFPNELPMKWTRKRLKSFNLKQLKDAHFERLSRKVEFDSRVSFFIAMRKQHELSTILEKDRIYGLIKLWSLVIVIVVGTLIYFGST